MSQRSHGHGHCAPPPPCCVLCCSTRLLVAISRSLAEIFSLAFFIVRQRGVSIPARYTAKYMVSHKEVRAYACISETLEQVPFLVSGALMLHHATIRTDRVVRAIPCWIGWR